MAGIYSWLKTVVIFMIFLTILSNLLGKSDFKKYINIATGLLLVLVTVNPILQFLKSDKGFDYFYDSVNFNLKTTEIANEMKDAEAGQQKRILAQYKKEIIDQIEQLLNERDLYLVRANVVINEDVNSEEYAKIQALEVEATYSAVDERTPDKVEIVVIPDVTIGGKEKKTSNASFLSPQEIQIKNMLSDFYNISAENINISIQGG